MQVRIHPSFKTQGRRYQKSKTGVSVATQKGLMSSKLKERTTEMFSSQIFCNNNLWQIFNKNLIQQLIQ